MKLISGMKEVQHSWKPMFEKKRLFSTLCSSLVSIDRPRPDNQVLVTASVAVGQAPSVELCQS